MGDKPDRDHQLAVAAVEEDHQPDLVGLSVTERDRDGQLDLRDQRLAWLASHQGRPRDQPSQAQEDRGKYFA